MKDNDTKLEFLALRAKGFSYARISEKLEVSKPTLIDWARQFRDDITNLRTIELEALQDQFYATRERRIKLLGEQLEKIEAELAKRDLSPLPTDKLIDLKMRLVDNLKKEETQTRFEMSGVFDLMGDTGKLSFTA